MVIEWSTKSELDGKVMEMIELGGDWMNGSKNWEVVRY